MLYGPFLRCSHVRTSWAGEWFRRMKLLQRTYVCGPCPPPPKKKRLPKQSKTGVCGPECAPSPATQLERLKGPYNLEATAREHGDNLKEGRHQNGAGPDLWAIVCELAAPDRGGSSESGFLGEWCMRWRPGRCLLPLEKWPSEPILAYWWAIVELGLQLGSSQMRRSPETTWSNGAMAVRRVRRRSGAQVFLQLMPARRCEELTNHRWWVADSRCGRYGVGVRESVGCPCSFSS